MIKLKHRFCDDHTGAPNDGFLLNILIHFLGYPEYL